jgi:hypothetical protein
VRAARPHWLSGVVRIAALALALVACSGRAAPPPATATATPASTVPAPFRACATDADCVAVDRAGCCHNGWKEAVAASQRDAYAAAFACAEPRPICAQYIVFDRRMPACDAASKLCVLVTTPDPVRGPSAPP